MNRQSPRHTPTLDAKILVALQQACRERELDVAEHLLRALETLERQPNGEFRRIRPLPLDEAYLSIAEGISPDPWISAQVLTRG